MQCVGVECPDNEEEHLANVAFSAQQAGVHRQAAHGIFRHVSDNRDHHCGTIPFPGGVAVLLGLWHSKDGWPGS